MQGNRELRNFDAALEAIKHSRSAFEQYHAMALTASMIDDLVPAQRQRLAEAIKAQRGWRFHRDTDRWQLSEDILRRLVWPEEPNKTPKSSKPCSGLGATATYRLR